ncbi:hypothetical protein MtrunA17_Chr3g0118271 [Medicago truncatula]|uniref:Uncharacterized protein n=1 Tax=Medicago truncatula TaxID=3880 RepID=A0A396ISZ3_MEDTR|nr:hypothetical protein MtrunA17_Chr3g0118271 [Medicago truncatula]
MFEDIQSKLPGGSSIPFLVMSGGYVYMPIEVATHMNIDTSDFSHCMRIDDNNILLGSYSLSLLDKK